MVSWEQEAQAQLYLDIFPSQDNTNQTLWLFSGSSGNAWGHSNADPYIRTSGAYDQQDTHKTYRALLQDPTSLTPAANYALTPLRTATATNAPLDFESLRTRLGATIKLGTTNTLDDITIPNTATNVPTIGYNLTNGTNTIANMHLNNVGNTGWDDIGPRTSSQLTYGSSARTVNWYGAGTMAKPISHFHVTPFTTQDRYTGNRSPNSGGILGSWTGPGVDNLRIRVHGSAIPEPEEYALVFGLFALGFVLFRRHFQKKQQRQQQQAQTATTS